MFRFSCFHANVAGNKAKKTVQPSTETMVKTFQDITQDRGCRDSSNSPSAYSSPLKGINATENHINNWDSVKCSCRSEDLNSKFSFESDCQVHQIRRLKKSQSLQSGLDQCIREDDEDQELSCDGAKSHNESTISISGDHRDANPIDQNGNNQNVEFQVSSSLANDASLFSIGDPTPSDKDAREISDTPLSGEFVGDIPDQTSVPGTPSLRKSRSLPNIRASILSFEKDAFKRALSMSRSSDDLHALHMRQKEEFINEFDDQIGGDQGRENDMGKADGHMDSFFDDGFDSYVLSSSAKDWVMPITDDTSDVKTLQGDSSVDCVGDFPKKDFKIKRIQDWVIDLQHCGPPLEETNEELPEVIEPLVNVNAVNGVTAATVDHRVTPGMEAAKRYISSLGANATAAQLANHGLVVIPFLSVFVSLKVLNLAGNAIVRITAGALPRGLHALNLSRNKISTIEGLRELTRLRVLDLSYNRILRIGHGLASCSSLKELYLAGNKISEVEGLHRLLKLSILDLRFNKISTAKCLGQLAANYNSLQAINLDGNPAQKNVGDEQMKKYLQGLLPHLVYYNRQPIKVSTLKDGSERSIRLGMNSHQFDRSLRADRKATRKGSHATRRSSPATSTHARRTVDSPKLSKGKQALLPPSRNKVSTQSRHQFDAISKALNSTSTSSMRKSRSEGNFGVL